MGAKLGKKDKRFETFIVQAENILVYPSYMEEGTSNFGDDLSILKLNEIQLNKIKKCHGVFIPCIPFQYKIFDQNYCLSQIDVLGFPADEFNKKYELYSSTLNTNNFEWSDLISISTYGDKGIIHYLNQTSGGQSG